MKPSSAEDLLYSEVSDAVARPLSEWMKAFVRSYREYSRPIYSVCGSSTNRFRKVVLHLISGSHMPADPPVVFTPLLTRQLRKNPELGTYYQARFRVTDPVQMEKCAELVLWLHRRRFKIVRHESGPLCCREKETEFVNILVERLFFAAELRRACMPET